MDPAKAGTFSAAFVLPITRDDRVLLTKEKRGKQTKYGMLGGVARRNETDFQCMSREAKEETGGALSLTTLARIAEGRGILEGDTDSRVFYENSKSFAVIHDLVVPADLDVDTRFEYHRLQSSGRGGQEESHLGPRHAIREARVQKRSPCVSTWLLVACGLRLCACAMHVLPKSPEARQS